MVTGQSTTTVGVKPPAPSDNETPKVPSIKVPAPPTPQQSQSNAQNNDTATGANGGGFNAGERTAVSEPAPQAAPRRSSLPKRLLPSSLQPRRFPSTMMQHRWLLESGGAEAIAEEEVPMGAFDAPVDPGSLGRGSGGYWNGAVGRYRRAPTSRDGAAAGVFRGPGAGQ